MNPHKYSNKQYFFFLVTLWVYISGLNNEQINRYIALQCNPKLIDLCIPQIVLVKCLTNSVCNPAYRPPNMNAII